MQNPQEYEDAKAKDPQLSVVYDLSAQYLIGKMNWKEGDVIMDYGCGTGKFAWKYLVPPILPVNPGKIFGVDISPMMIAFAKSNFKHNLIEFSVGDIMNEESWSFEKGSIDKFISYLVLANIHDYRSLLKKVFDILKPGGQVGVMIPFSKANAIPYEVLATEKWSEYDKKELFRISNWAREIGDKMVDFRVEAQTAGFKLLDYRVEDFKWNFPTAFKLCEFMSIISAASVRIPDNLKKEFMNDMINFTKDFLPIPQTIYDPCFIHWKFVTFVAEK